MTTQSICGWICKLACELRDSGSPVSRHLWVLAIASGCTGLTPEESGAQAHHEAAQTLKPCVRNEAFLATLVDYYSNLNRDSGRIIFISSVPLTNRLRLSNGRCLRSFKGPSTRDHVAADSMLSSMGSPTIAETEGAQRYCSLGDRLFVFNLSNEHSQLLGVDTALVQSNHPDTYDCDVPDLFEPTVIEVAIEKL